MGARGQNCIAPVAKERNWIINKDLIIFRRPRENVPLAAHCFRWCARWKKKSDLKLKAPKYLPGSGIGTRRCAVARAKSFYWKSFFKKWIGSLCYASEKQLLAQAWHADNIAPCILAALLQFEATSRSILSLWTFLCALRHGNSSADWNKKLLQARFSSSRLLWKMRLGNGKRRSFGCRFYERRLWFD